VIERKQTRVFTDTLAPTLIVAESRWARDPCAIATSKAGVVQLKNGFLQLEVSTAGKLKETRLVNRLTDEAVPAPRSLAFVIRTDRNELTSADFKVARVDTSGSDEQASHLQVDLTAEKLDVTAHYELRRQDHFYHKWLTLKNKGSGDLQVRDVVVSSLDLPRTVDLMAGQELTYPISRLEKGGFFS
jgi:hypothetical protein